ncbi:MAG TPA: hypothetical protein VKU39_16225 [Streptosporangiaceae bacterium]|nr:hypothetical protein [Streptosporangiaceae bacterium]
MPLLGCVPLGGWTVDAAFPLAVELLPLGALELDDPPPPHAESSNAAEKRPAAAAAHPLLRMM